ncbi:MAG: hypothetical protein ACFFD4_37215 [Candidatus Odinarchaeota archaeon]
MNITLSGSEMVKEILSEWEAIYHFTVTEVRTWRRLKVDRIESFSRELADSFYEKFKDSSEALVTKDYFYSKWGTVAITAGGISPWYYPFSLIELCAFGVELDDLLDELGNHDNLINIHQFSTAIINLERSVSVRFKRREIEILTLITTRRDDTSTGILTYEELATILGLSRPVVKEYWENLKRFFLAGILINYGKIGLFPVAVKHYRELTPLEKQYTKYSFYHGSYYHSLLFIPRESSWVEENQQVDDEFELLGPVDRMDHGWNLTYLTEKPERRWGSYPGIQKKSVALTGDTMIFDRNERPLEGLQVKDFAVLKALAHNVGRLKTGASYLNVSEAYYSQRVSFLAEKGVFVTKVDLYACGLDVDLFIIIHTERNTGKEIIKEVPNTLSFFPHRVVFSGEHCLLAKIKIPSHWLRRFFVDIENLTEPGGHWYDKGITAATHVNYSRDSLVNRLINLDELIVKTKSGVGERVTVDWTFEIPE